MGIKVVCDTEPHTEGVKLRLHLDVSLDRDELRSVISAAVQLENNDICVQDLGYDLSEMFDEMVEDTIRAISDKVI